MCDRPTLSNCRAVIFFVFSVVETSQEIYTLLGIAGEVCVTKDRKPVLEVAPTALASELNTHAHTQKIHVVVLYLQCQIEACLSYGNDQG